MSRDTFNTGKDHQKRVATWVRTRLVDHGRKFNEEASGKVRKRKHQVVQNGVVLADAVGMGKTWEALAASALILVKRSRRRTDGRKMQNAQQRLARVLVICPPKLVTKWSREIRDPDGFSKYLAKWARRPSHRGFVMRTLTKPYEIRFPNDLRRSKYKRNRLVLPGGTYVCNWNVLRNRQAQRVRKLDTMLTQDWDVVIVDEAHHGEARKALEQVVSRVRRTSKRPALLLLTATPFQLDPSELHDLFGQVLSVGPRGGRHTEHMVLRPKRKVGKFVERLKNFFGDRDAGPPSRGEKRDAEEVLHQLMVRNKSNTKGRKYHLIGTCGDAVQFESPEQLTFDKLRTATASLIAPPSTFEQWYLRQRIRLASGTKPTCVQTKLRQFLSTPGQAARAAGGRCQGTSQSPRLNALVHWVERRFDEDFRKTINDGIPRKLLVFTSYVKSSAREIKEAIDGTMAGVLKALHADANWRKLKRDAERTMESFIDQLRCKLHDEVDGNGRPLIEMRQACKLISDLHDIAPSSDFFPLLGKSEFAKLVTDDLIARIRTLGRIDEQSTAQTEEPAANRFLKSMRRRERNRLKATIDEVIRGDQRVATYAGNDRRLAREAAGEAFRSPLGPWALVASDVGSEGIDLHTFCAHVVHFDIEWNPAKMEQREGRGDRLGRKLSGPMNVYHLFVRGTYDERMLHQLVARQRWHSVLLGKPAAGLVRETEDDGAVRLINAGDVRRCLLDLSPPR